MEKYISVEFNMRGFFYTEKRSDVTSFWEAMQDNIDNDNNEIEFAKCISSTGEVVAEYCRGCEIPEMPIFKGTREALERLARR